MHATTSLPLEGYVLRINRFVGFRQAGSIALALALVSPAYGARLWGVTTAAQGQQLLWIDTTDPSANTISLGAVDFAADPLGIGATSTTIWIFDAASQVLRQITPVGSTIRTIDLGTGGLSEGDLTLDVDGTSGFLVSPNGGAATLIRFDLITETATTLATNLPLMMGLTVGEDGYLYGLGKGGDPLDPGPPPTFAELGLYRIDRYTGASTQIATLPGITCYDERGSQQSCNIGGLTFAEGLLYAVAGSLAPAPNIAAFPNLYVIDPATGNSTNFGAIGFQEIAGIATFVDIPEPSGLFLTLSALLGGWRLSKRS